MARSIQGFTCYSLIQELCLWFTNPVTKMRKGLSPLPISQKDAFVRALSNADENSSVNTEIQSYSELPLSTGTIDICEKPYPSNVCRNCLVKRDATSPNCFQKLCPPPALNRPTRIFISLTPVFHPYLKEENPSLSELFTHMRDSRLPFTFQLIYE